MQVLAVVLFLMCAFVNGLTQETTPTSKPDDSSDFYGHSCNADTYVPQWGSVSSVLAIINGSIVTVSSGIFLIYACFSKFLTTMTS
ncbi:envelope glycoprotein N [Wood mouse herpesvirus]|uniref:Envelope glycoprotein N n=1 Tax=Wood mouse herpesvirus TaxID=432370 RepID=D0U1P2_9GAMA|nr:envelope glycoprotein N [Wood mouse herpesvirus]ACY41149.1 envelope glycoprotein N [Wood mouse herpesvirus]